MERKQGEKMLNGEKQDKAKVDTYSKNSLHYDHTSHWEVNMFYKAGPINTLISPNEKRQNQNQLITNKKQDINSYENISSGRTKVTTKTD